MAERESFKWPTSRRDYSSEDLSRRVFENLVIEGESLPALFVRADFRGSRFVNTRVRGADFSRSDFSDVSLKSTEFERCKFDFAGLQDAFMEDVEFRGCSANTTEISNSRITGLVVSGGDLTGSTLVSNNFDDSIFDGVSLERATVEANHFYRCKFKGVDLANQSVLHCSFTECTFERSRMDVDILSTCAGLRKNELADVEWARRGKSLPDQDLEKVLDGLYARHSERGEFLEACNVAVISEKPGLFEKTYARLPHFLDAEPESKSSFQILRLARKLLYWNGRDLVSPYWLAWTASTIADRVTGIEGRKIESNHEILEAASLLAPAIESYQREIIARIAPATGGSLLGTLPVSVKVRDALDVAGTRDLIEELNRYAAPRLPRSLEVPDGLLQFEYTGHRRGSLVVDGTMFLGGLMFLKVFLEQSREVVRSARSVFDEWNSTTRPAPINEAASPPATPREMTALASPHPQERALQTAANLEFIVRVSTRLAPPPNLREELAENVISVEVSIAPKPRQEFESPKS